ncbi:MAG: flippase-like domain-containing protein [Proteobacteria bacterium]|nr:flippase-like domain-containing protein [Pseudomonadota bacterium]
MNKKLILSLCLGLIFSGLALYLAFRNIPVRDLVHYLGTVNYAWLIPVSLSAFLSFILRVFRWKWILKSYKPVSFWGAFHPLMIGFMLNCILPGRMGELARPIILAKREKIPFSTGVASVVCERLFDLICLILFLVLSLSYITIDPALTVTVGKYQLTGATLTHVCYGMAKLCLALIVGIILVSIKVFRELLANFVISIPKYLVFLSIQQRNWLETKVFRPASRLIEHFADGLALLKNPGKILACLGITLAIWVVQALSYYLMTFACPGLDVSFPQIVTVMVMICFFIALPSVPGYWGIWEAGGIFALTLFSVAGESAAGYTLINHVVQIVPVIIAGMISALMIGINFKQLFNQDSSNV